MIHDLITIGGGAAGFFGAITHAELSGRSTLILEKTDRNLTKVKISGGGRCNVTHHIFEPRQLAKNYPRGERALIGPLHHWSSADTVAWFTERGVKLKTEPDGRMFPVSDDSQTIIDCLLRAAKDAGVKIRTRCGVTSITVRDDLFHLLTESGETLQARHVLLATGGTRMAAGAKLAEQLGHTLEPAVPSLFTFKISDPILDGIPGVSVAKVTCRVESEKLSSTGPLLITHWGLSGPGILRLSAWGARRLADIDYRFTLVVNWLPDIENIKLEIQELRRTRGKRQLHSSCPFETLPKRLWLRLLASAGIPDDQTWAQFPKSQSDALAKQLAHCEFSVTGKSLNKEEFVTCGGVKLQDINLKTMESKICPGLHFAGEIMDIDGITGGFNFQNAWTSGHLAGSAIAEK